MMKQTNSAQEKTLKIQVKELQNQLEELKKENRIRIIITFLINILEKYFVS